ncbi:hypothetical protein SUGI_0754600 [Cryptomeria japonica]|nr:hypothetical protein SUGI_0754600 [Cryptomeria japonica]
MKVNAEFMNYSQPIEWHHMVYESFITDKDVLFAKVAQEVFRCEHPEEKVLYQLLGSKITLSIYGDPFPSVLYYDIPPSYYGPLQYAHVRTTKSKKMKLCACTLVFNVAEFIRERVGLGPQAKRIQEVKANSKDLTSGALLIVVTSLSSQRKQHSGISESYIGQVSFKCGNFGPSGLTKHPDRGDRTPGLSNKTIQPQDWGHRFCAVNDTALKDFAIRVFSLSNEPTSKLEWQL